MNCQTVKPAATSITCEQGFSDAVGAVAPSLRAYARRLSGNCCDVDDLVQETMLCAWRARERFEPGSNLRAWLFRILRNNFLTGHRRAMRSVHLEPEVIDRLLTARASQEDRLITADYDRAIAAFPAAMREALLATVDGGGHGQIAEELSVNRNTFRNRVHRARTMLSQHLDAEPDAMGSSLPVEVRQTERPPRDIYVRWKREGSNLIG